MNENIYNGDQTGEELNESAQATAENPAQSDDATENIENETENLKNQVAELKDKYLRLVADFDNFRKRSAKERLELIQTASKDLITSLLTVLDDSERAEKQMLVTQDIEAIKEGEKLVFNKLRNTLQSKGLKPMETIGNDFNPEFHEAITEIPAPNETMKGKVLDEVEKGYYLNDKIIRFAKVVVGK
ncbi:MAG TPA: nucleotide exchange factor GrpE [Flavitalea sp.]|nr:nucleotide exchange factor GrpE [Flavitalea sp.]